MKIPLYIAEKLLLLSRGKRIPDSSARHTLIDELVLEGILDRKGRIKKTIQLQDINSLNIYLQNHYGISDLDLYIQVNKKEDLIRADLVLVSSDSKLKIIRTFKGFIVNCYSHIQTTLNDEILIIQPREGTFNFIYDFEKIIPSKEITIVGIENPENFRHIDKQKYLFNDIKPLFVSRYPQNQSKDLIKWLQSIPNNYLHFGDFDFAGIGIYLNEFKKYLSDRTTFFVPENIDKLIADFGNKKRYNEQKINFDTNNIKEDNLLKLIASIHKHKKGLDQEILIKKNQCPNNKI